MKKASIEKKLTEGSVVKQLIKFALPFMLSNLIQTLYNVADMFIVGKYCGTSGISGVNIGGFYGEIQLKMWTYLKIDNFIRYRMFYFVV